MSEITTTKEVFDIPLDYYSKAFAIDYEDVTSIMFLKASTDSVLVFTEADGAEFRCTLQDYKNENVKIYPITICEQPL